MSTLAPVSSLSTASTSLLKTQIQEEQKDFSLLLEDNLFYKKPTVKELRDLTGIDFKTATEFLYGVVGSKEDTRDWNSILQSTDIIASIQEETSRLNDSSKNQQYAKLKTEDVVAKTQHLAVVKNSTNENSSATQTHDIVLTDTQGNILRHSGHNAQTIAQNTWLFGIQAQEIEELAIKVPSIQETLNQSLLSYTQLEKNKTTLIQQNQSKSFYVTTQEYLNTINTSSNQTAIKQDSSLLSILLNG